MDCGTISEHYVFLKWTFPLLIIWMLVLIENTLTSKDDSVTQHTLKYPLIHRITILNYWLTGGLYQRQVGVGQPHISKGPRCKLSFLITNKELLAWSYLPQVLIHISPEPAGMWGAFRQFISYIYFIVVVVTITVTVTVTIMVTITIGRPSPCSSGWICTLDPQLPKC